MKRRLAAVLLAVMMILDLLPALPAQALSAQPSSASVLPETGSREDLSVLDYEVTVDEASDAVVTRLILENTGNETLSLDYALPLISAGAEPGTLELSASDEAERTSEKTVYFSLKPKAVIVLSYAYQAGSSLVNAGAIGVDFKQLIFREDGRIGHFSICLTLREEDLPLVNEISPVSYRIEGCEISLELYDFAPSVLLDRFYLTKETYRNLKGNRDWEPNEEQQAVLENYRKWFREGIGVDLAALQDDWYPSAQIFPRMIGAEITPGEPYLQPYSSLYSRLAEGSPAYVKIVDYLILREHIRQGRDYEITLYEEGPVFLDLLRKTLYGEEIRTVVIGYEREPSLEGVTLYRGRSLKREEAFEWIPATEESLLLAEPYDFYSVKYNEEYCLYRISVLGPSAEADPAVLSAYLELMQADAFVVQRLLDDREQKVDIYDQYGMPVTALYACPEEGPVTEADLTAASKALDLSYLPIRVLRQPHALAGSLPCLFFTQYTGRIVEADGEAHYEPFSFAGYLSAQYGLLFYGAVVQTETGRAFRQQMAEKKQLTQQQCEARIRPMDGWTLREVPFYEAGDRTALSVLALDVEVFEESDRVTTRLLLENTGTEPVTACLPLPILRNGAAEGSLLILKNSKEADGQAEPVSGNRILVTLAGGAALDLSFRYAAASRLIHAGAIALDLEPLVFSEGGRIGRFSIAVTLREEDVPLVTEICPINYTFDGRTVSVTLCDFAPNRLLSRFYLTKNSYRDLMGSREYEPSEAELYVLENYRKWFREGLPLPEKITLEGSLSSPLETVLNLNGQHPGYYVAIQQRLPLFRVMLHLCLKALKEHGQLTDEWAASFLSYYWEATSLAPLTLDGIRETAFGEDPVLAAVEYSKESTLTGVPLYTAEWEPELQGDEVVTVRKVFPVYEEQLLRATREEPGSFHYKRENLRVLTIPAGAAPSAEELQDTLDALGVSLYIRTKLMDNRDGAYGKVTYAMPEMPNRELYRQAYFSVPEEAVLTPETLKEALLSKQFTMIWYDESFFTVLEAADPELAALTVPAFTQYAGVVEREEDKAMVTILTLGGNPLYAECGLKNYRAVLSTEAAGAALAAQQARQEEKIRHVIQKIESVTK